MRRLAALALAFVATAAPARAQLATYCGGAIQAEVFIRQVSAGGRASYSVTLRNAGTRPRSVTVLVTGAFADRPVPTPRSMAPGSRATFALGTQMLLGRAPLRDNELAEVVRITCG